MINRFVLSSSDCELLLELETAVTIEATARAVNKDPSVVCRQLNRIFESYPAALEKRAGRWIITDVGRQLNSQTRDMIRAQNQLAEKKVVLRIGTNREFATRIMAPQIQTLTNLFRQSKLMIYTFENGTEWALRNGNIDIGIDCDRPLDPDVAYKQIIPEPIVAVASKLFIKKYKTEIEKNGLYQSPHLACERLMPDKIFAESENKLNVIAYFNDIATARAACLTGLGWSLLPRYTIQKEIESKQLYVLREKQAGLSKYGVWWSRSRFTNKDVVLQMCEWLKEQRL